MTYPIKAAFYCWKWLLSKKIIDHCLVAMSTSAWGDVQNLHLLSFLARFFFP